MSETESNTSSHSTTRRRTWIFQANPLLYNIHDSLRAEHEEKWNLRQHHQRVKINDRVLIWISKKRAGIYALGSVKTSPSIESDSPRGIYYWNDKRQGYKPVSRVWVRYERIFIDHPLLREFLLCDPDLWNLSILRNPRGTNFTVTDAEWNAIESWLV